MLAAFLIKSQFAQRVNVLVGGNNLIERDFKNFKEAFEMLGIKAATSRRSNNFDSDD